VWQQLPPLAGKTAAALHKSLRSLSAGASLSPSAALPRSPGRLHSPALLSRASTSGSNARPESRSKAHAEEGVGKKEMDGEEAERRGDGNGGRSNEGRSNEGSCAQGHPSRQELPRTLKAVVACLSAACSSLAHLAADREALQVDMTRREQEHQSSLQDQISAHRKELEQRQAMLEEERLAHAAYRATATQELEAMRAAASDADVLHKDLQAQLVMLHSKVEEMQASSATAAAESGARVRALEEELAEARAACASKEAQIGELEKLAAEERASEQVKLTSALSELDEARRELSRLNRDGIVLTPRPCWEGQGGHLEDRTSAARVATLLAAVADAEARTSALEADTASLAASLTAAREEGEQQRALRKTAEDLVETQAAELRAMRDRIKGSDASCGCPEPPDDPSVEMVELSEYLANYLSKRFGLQGHMSSWEVEKVSKDLGWIMQLQVRSSAGP